MSVALESSPELQHQLETVVSDVAVVRRIVERLAAVQEQMALDFATLKSPTRMSAKKCRCPLTLRPPSRRANMRQALRALMLLRTHPPYLSGPLPLNHPWRRTDPPALRLLGCIRARPGMVNYCECRSVGLRGSTSVFLAAGSDHGPVPQRAVGRCQGRQRPCLPQTTAGAGLRRPHTPFEGVLQPTCQT